MELLSLPEELKMVEEMSLVPVDINVNSKEVIIRIREGNLHCDAIIDECRFLIRRLECP